LIYQRVARYPDSSKCSGPDHSTYFRHPVAPRRLDAWE